ncbi:MAG: Crp/Fnr family transcriptional regulator [Lautropia sp.]
MDSIPAALRDAGARVRLARGQTLFRTGASARAVYFVESGLVRLERHGRNGEAVVLHEARAGEYFAEASLGSDRYHCDAVAAEPSGLLACEATTLRRLLCEDPGFAMQWSVLLARQLRATRARVERLSLRGATERVRHLLECDGVGPRREYVVTGTYKDLARDLGLSHEVLYRTLARMAREGTVARVGNVLSVPGPRAAKRMTGII